MGDESMKQREDNFFEEEQVTVAGKEENYPVKRTCYKKE